MNNLLPVAIYLLAHLTACHRSEPPKPVSYGTLITGLAKLEAAAQTGVNLDRLAELIADAKSEALVARMNDTLRSAANARLATIDHDLQLLRQIEVRAITHSSHRDEQVRLNRFSWEQIQRVSADLRSLLNQATNPASSYFCPTFESATPPQ